MTGGERFLFDSNVLLDIITDDPVWADWSSEALAVAARSGPTFINPIIYAEVSVSFDDLAELDARMPATILQRAPLPYSAAFLAAKAHAAYRRRGGTRATTLPDFFIGAHAMADGLTLVSRDARRYRRDFPGIRLIAP